jgi:hypothetical protein
MSKWASVFNPATAMQLAQLVQIADPIGANCTNCTRSETLENELKFLQAKWQACLWIQKLPHYKELSASCYQAEREAFARMKSQINEIKNSLRTG